MVGQNIDQVGQTYSPDLNDKRYLPRWEVNNRILFKPSNEIVVHEARSKDISCSGACVVTKDRYERRQKVELTIYLTDKVSVNLDGEVKWQKTVDDGYLLGINFCEAPTEAKEIILNYAFEIKREDLVKHWFKGWD